MTPEGYPTPAQLAILSWSDLQTLVFRLYRELDNERFRCRDLDQQLAANRRAFRECGAVWPGDEPKYEKGTNNVENVGRIRE